MSIHTHTHTHTHTHIFNPPQHQTPHPSATDSNPSQPSTPSSPTNQPIPHILIPNITVSINSTIPFPPPPLLPRPTPPRPYPSNPPPSPASQPTPSSPPETQPLHPNQNLPHLPPPLLHPANQELFNLLSNLIAASKERQSGCVKHGFT